MASAKVRGITIELSADTTGILKGLKSANTAVMNTQKELKDLDKLLKLNPTNMTLLRQKTQLLQQQIGNAKTKLEQLKKAEAKMKADGVDENSEQFRALKREIESTEMELDELNRTMGSGSARLEQLSQGAKKASEKLTNAGKALMPVSAGVVALGVAAVKTAADFDSQMSKVSAISGATGDEIEQLRDKAREMGEKTKFSATEAGQGFEYMAMAGWKTEDMLEGIEPIMNLAAASGEELGTTSDIVTDALTAFGLSAEEAGHFADVLAATSSNANTNVSMMGESFKYVAPVAGALGFSVDDVAVALGLMANSGIKASTAGTTLRTLLSNMAKPTDEMATAMDALGVSLDDGQGNMKSFAEIMQDLRKGFKGLKTPSEDAMKAIEQLDKELEDGTITQEQYDGAVNAWMKSTYGAEGALKAEAAAALAGNRGMSGLLAIVNASEEDFNKLTDAVDNSAGSAKEMADTMQDNLAGQITILKSQLQELAISFGEKLMPVIRKVVEKIQNLVDKFNNLSDSQKETILKVGALVAALAPALLIAGKVAGAISKISGLLSTMKVMSFLTNPVTLAVGAVAALAGGIAVLWDNIEKSNGHLGEFAEKTKELSEANDALAEDIKTTARETETATTNAQAEADTAEKLAEKLDELAQKENKTAGEKQQIKDIVEKLNELVPNLSLAYDEETDSLNKTNEEIKKNITLRKEQAKSDAWASGYTESLEEAAEAEITLAEAQDHFNEMLKEAGTDVQAHYKEWKKFGELGVPWDGLELAKYRDDMIKLSDAEKAVTDAQKNVTEANKNADRYYQRLEQSATNVAKAEAEVAKEANAISLEGFKTELENALGDKYTKTLDNAITKAQKAGYEIPEELKTQLLNGEVKVSTAVKKITKAVDKQLKAEAEEAQRTGQATSNKYSTSLAAGKNKAKQAALDNVSNVNTGLSTGKDKASSRGSETGSAYANGIGSKDNVENVRTQAGKLPDVADAELQKNEAYKRGVEFVRGYADGLQDLAAKGAVTAAAIALANIPNQTVKTTQNSGSPSRVAMERGREFGEGYAIGIEEMMKKAKLAGASLVSVANKGITGSALLSANQNGAIGGAGIVTNNYTQNNYSPKALSTSDIYRQTHNLVDLKGAYYG